MLMFCIGCDPVPHRLSLEAVDLLWGHGGLLLEVNHKAVLLFGRAINSTTSEPETEIDGILFATEKFVSVPDF